MPDEKRRLATGGPVSTGEPFVMTGCDYIIPKRFVPMPDEDDDHIIRGME